MSNPPKPDTTVEYAIIHTLDTGLLCDQDTLNKEFNGSWEDWLKWFWGEEKAELLLGMQENKYPPQIAFKTYTLDQIKHLMWKIHGLETESSEWEMYEKIMQEMR